MEKVTMYKVNGKLFQDYRKAEEYEKLCKKVNGIMKQLLPRTEEVENTEDYNKHNLVILRDCYFAFIKTICTIELFKYTIPIITKDNFNNDAKYTILDRVLRIDDCGEYSIIHDTIYRFKCIDFETGFEFSQPYYVTHQEEFFNHIKYIKNK